MLNTYEDKDDRELFEGLTINCEKCFGLCCVALYFSASEGFPANKEAGVPCMNLQGDFSCAMHQHLRKQGLKGCTAYDCFGAGQKVAQVTYGGKDWRKVPGSSKQMFDVFLVMRQLHEMLWYLTEAFSLEETYTIKEDIHSILKQTEGLTHLSAGDLLKLDVAEHRTKVNVLLLQTSELVRANACHVKKVNSKSKKRLTKGFDFIGADLRKTNLVGADLKGALLIAANLRDADLSGTNLIGADLRDTDIRGADLIESLFLTQPQINTARGNQSTKLSKVLSRPKYWENE